MAIESTLLTEFDTAFAGAGLEILQGETINLKLEGQDKTLPLPPSMVALLKRIFTEMAQGRSVDIVSLDAELTTQQAADMLNVSRPFVIKLLDNGELSHRLVGRHRRVLLQDILAYKEKMQRKSRDALDELARLSQEMDTY